jgi:hypothetical protein
MLRRKLDTIFQKISNELYHDYMAIGHIVVYNGERMQESMVIGSHKVPYDKSRARNIFAFFLNGHKFMLIAHHSLLTAHKIALPNLWYTIDTNY